MFGQMKLNLLTYGYTITGGSCRKMFSNYLDTVRDFELWLVLGLHRPLVTNQEPNLFIKFLAAFDI